ncbi:uncharacterized protein [Cardiocondyla obscurior]|uniref:uncharacterized protein n=1 Tax=Cardiocondyla obscurior TaxID=286306 RepID=UPI0039656DA4
MELTDGNSIDTFAINHSLSPQLLTSAMVHVSDINRMKSIKCRALLDTGATANFITESLIKRLKIKAEGHSLPVNTINSTGTVSKSSARVIIQSMHSNFSKNLTCLTLPSISNSIPSEICQRNTIAIPANIKLADPDFHLPRPVDLLIGSGPTLSIFSVGQINLSQNDRDLYLQKMRLGWVIGGDASITSKSETSSCYLSNLENQITKFWTIEEVFTNKPYSKEEIECENFYIKTVSRRQDGRYVVRLPFRVLNKFIGESRSIALKRLFSLERKLTSNPNLKLEYERNIKKYKMLNHMSEIKTPSDHGFYMPHHAVFKDLSNTTKVRIVFDASAKSNNGISLNDILMVGPTIQDKLLSHIIRFRSYNYVFSADIEKMYRQVLVHEDDRQFQRILWRENSVIKTLQLNTLTFGVSSSPYLAIRTLHKLADDEVQSFPRASNVLKHHMYVDDLLSGADTVDEARAIRDEIIALLSRGGFAIRQWASNDLHIISDLDIEAVHMNLILDNDRSLKTLGVTWNTRDDKICYTTHIMEISGAVTKRKVLSEIARIFDPIGLIGPIVFFAKRLMQDVWRTGINWDESLPQSIHTQWSEFRHQLKDMRCISFDRRVICKEYNNVQIHGFCDASNNGYGACLYVRSTAINGEVFIKLICSKSRVAPLKTITIPRLELCGALLMARLYSETIKTVNINPDKIIFWCDSTIVLHWLKTSPHLLKTYVANRVAEISEITNLIEWRHIRTSDNPADALSRGQLPRQFINNKLWPEGPAWLLKNESEWHNETIPIITVPEMKTNSCLFITLDEPEFLKNYSSFSKLSRIIAYCRRFKTRNRFSGPLSSDEVIEAEEHILKIIQSSYFHKDIKIIKDNRTSYFGKLVYLNPFLDDKGLLRIGGRLQASKLTFSQKHPILLPSQHQLTDKIIREIHENHFHTGIQTTLYILRRKFWLLDGRNQVRRIIRSCIRCRRFTPDTITYKMGNLPSSRIQRATPFDNTGIDFCGPFYIKEKKYKNRSRIKVYVCVFVCMVVKAIHLELVSDLSTDGFLAAFRRFTARRGVPSNVYSDNGSNFVGANNEMKALYALLNSDDHKNSIYNHAIEKRISWHFIPPAAPHFGGLWESSVKLFKHHYKRVIGDSLFTFEELNTFTAEIEGILNSRPITCISSDPNDPLALTPAHYLIGKPITSLPEAQLSSVPDNRLSVWQHISKVRQDFWKRWNIEYLNELQKRTKWIKDGPKVEVDAIVLIKDKNISCTQWLLGRIASIHPGEDGTVRAATVKTAHEELKRAVKYLCPLPIEQ